MTGTTRTTAPRVFFYFLRHFQRIDGIMENALRDEGLTTGQYTVLSSLKRFEPCTSAELARRQNMTAQSMGEYLSALEAKGLVERNYQNGNRRNLFVKRTEKGLAIQDRCDKAVLEAEEAYISRLPADERARFVDNLTRLYQK
ncbi:MAG: MarR family transcriptional regulator [Pararhodobacter sp.]|nr:MarR family transcriptional regulator [Pararhodobacter sp.]